MNLTKVKNELTEFIESKNWKLFDISYHKNDQTLSVLLDEKFTMDQLEAASADISVFMDRFDDEFEANYFLDVSTVGAERPIRNENEVKDALGSYIYVKTKEEEYYGTLKEFKDGILLLEVSDKNRNKEISLDYHKTKKVRYAVKF